MKFNICRFCLLILFAFTANNFYATNFAFAESAKHAKPEAKKPPTKKPEKKPEKKEAKKEHSEAKVVAKSKEEEIPKPEVLDKEEIKGEDATIDSEKLEKEVAQLGKIDAVLIIDSSRSMQRTDPQKLREQAAKLFVRLLSEGDRLAIISFDKESKEVLPLTEVRADTIETFDQAISGIVYEGGFTDIESALSQANKVLSEEGRKDVAKSVLLLSDGKMDPYPERGEPIDLIKQTESKILMQYRVNKIKLYTVALSEQADKELLSRFAKLTEGVDLFALDSSTIHKKFSELFLKIKQPQLLSLEGENFEMDPDVKESTFFIERNEKITTLVLSDPKGTEINRDQITPNVKWYTDDKVDLITVYDPTPGKWTLKSNEKLDGFARLLTDVKLYVHFPAGSFNFGESAAVYAKLVNKDEQLSKEELSNITFYTYKIIDVNTGEVAYNGILNDKGENGDKEAGDGIYSAVIKFDVKGEFQALFGVTAPTFTRQQRFPMTVSKESISIKLRYEEEKKNKEDSKSEEVSAEEEKSSHSEHEDEHVAKDSENKHEGNAHEEKAQKVKSIIVSLSEGYNKLKAAKVKLILKRTGFPKKQEGEEGKHSEKKSKKSENKNDIFLVNLKANPKTPGIFEYPVEKLEPGEYEVYAKLTALDDKGKELNSNSSSLKMDVESDEREIIKQKLEVTKLITGVSSIFIAFIWVSVLTLYMRRKNRASAGYFEKIKEEVIADSIIHELESLKAKSSQTKRKPNEKDLAIFGDIPDVYVEEQKVEENSEQEISDQEVSAASQAEHSEASESVKQEAEEKEEEPQQEQHP